MPLNTVKGHGFSFRAFFGCRRHVLITPFSLTVPVHFPQIYPSACKVLHRAVIEFIAQFLQIGTFAYLYSFRSCVRVQWCHTITQIKRKFCHKMRQPSTKEWSFFAYHNNRKCLLHKVMTMGAAQKMQCQEWHMMVQWSRLYRVSQKR